MSRCTKTLYGDLVFSASVTVFQLAPTSYADVPMHIFLQAPVEFMGTLRVRLNPSKVIRENFSNTFDLLFFDM